MSISTNVIRRAKSFQHLFRMERNTYFHDKQWVVAMESFRRLSKSSNRQTVLVEGKRLSERVTAQLAAASPELAGEVALTFGQLGLRSPGILRACKKLDFSQGRVVDLTNYLWGVSLLREVDRGHYYKVAFVVEEIVSNGGWINSDDSRRLHISSLVGRVHKDCDILGPASRKAVNVGLDIVADMATNPSKLQNTVTAYVADCVPSHWEMEVEYFLEGFHLDIAFPEQKIAIEVDGPYHYYPDSDEPVTKDLLKDYVLERLGWRVIHINYKDWAKNNVNLNFIGR